MVKRSKRTLELKQPRKRPRWAHIETQGDRIIVSCSECNFVDADRVRRLYTLLVGVMKPQFNIVELDLRQVSGADTKLIAALVSTVRTAHDCGVKLVIHSSPQMRQLIRVCRLDEIINPC